MNGTPLLTALTPSDEEQAIAALLDILRTDPVLAAAGVQVWANEGIENRLHTEEFTPDETQLPLIRLLDDQYPIQVESDRTHRGRLAVAFHLYAPGSHYADRFRLWNAFRAALFPADPTRRGWVEAQIAAIPNLHARAVTLTSGGSQKILLGHDQYATRATATIYLPFTIHTLL